MAENVKMWMPLVIGDLLADTMHLSTEQFGAYMKILIHQWRRGHMRPDTLQAITGLSPDAWSIAQGLLLQMLSTDEDGLLYSPRGDSEKDRAERKRRVFNERARKAAEARWKPHRERKAKEGERQAKTGSLGNASSIPQALLEQCPSPSQLNTSPTYPFPLPSGDRPHSPTLAPETGEGDRDRKSSEDMEKANKRPVERSRSSGVGRGITKESADARQPLRASNSGSLHFDQTTRKTVESLKALIFAFWVDLNGGISCTWGKRDQDALERFVMENPGIGEDEMRECLKHRKESVLAGEFLPTIAPRKWISSALQFYHHPIGRNRKALRHVM